MKIYFRNPGMTEFVELDYDDWKGTRYLDAHRADQFTIKCHRRVPIQRYAKITAKEGGDNRFLGYVGKTSLVNKTRTLTCYGDEELLLHRFTGRAHYFPDVTRLYHPFQSDAPNQSADTYGVTYNCGLLFLANSLIPPSAPSWTLEDSPTWTWKLPGGGSGSRLGTSDIYVLSGVVAQKLTEQASLAACEANDLSVYRDANDLYIQISPVDEGPFANILAANAFDTNVRLGNLDNPELALANMQMADDTPGECLMSLGDFFKQPCKIRRGSDGFTYMDSVEDDGSDAAIFDLPESQCSSVEQTEGTERYLHGLTGLGVGGRDSQHRYTKMDLSYKGVWYQDKMDFPDQFGLYDDTGGLLQDLTDDEWARRRANESWKVVTRPSWAPRPIPGQYLNLILLDDKGQVESTEKLRIESISDGASGSQTFELGRRVDDIMDGFNPKANLSQVYLYEYLQELYSPASSYGDIQFGDSVHGICAGFTGTVTVPDDVDDTGNNHRVTMDIGITLQDEGSHVVGPATVYLMIGGTISPQHVFTHYMIGDTISGIDITSRVSYGSETTVVVYCQFQGNWLPSHSDCSGHPDGNCNLTFHAYKRMAVT